MSDITEILTAIDQGDGRAVNELLAIVYDELRRIAAIKMSQESAGQTLQTTALVHEAFMRLMGPVAEAETRPASESVKDGSTESAGWAMQSRRHFFSAAAESMRKILIDNARRRNRQKRGGGWGRVELDDIDAVSDRQQVDFLALNEALSKLEARDEQKANIVKLRFFAGLTLEEVATALELSIATVHRHWRFARAWLRSEMEDQN